MDTEIPLSPQWLMKVGENKVSPHRLRQLLLVLCMVIAVIPHFFCISVLDVGSSMV
jgi:hypothetical protein